MVSNVPDEILLKIFSKLTQKQLLLNVAFVNKQFHRVSKDPTLLKILNLENIDSYVYDSVECLLKNATNIEKVILNESVFNEVYLIELAFQTSNVLTTFVVETKLTKSLAKVLSEHGQKLEHLDLTNCTFENGNEIVNYLKSMTNLKTIKFKQHFSNTYSSDELISMVSNYKNLMEATLPNIEKLSNEFMDNFCCKVKDTLTKLEVFCFMHLYWDFQALGLSEKLTHLELSLISVKLNMTQARNLGKIQNLKSFLLFSDRTTQFQEGTAAMSNLFSNLPISQLNTLGVYLACESKVVDVFRFIIPRLGKNLKKLGLACYSMKNCLKVCPNNEALKMDDIRTILDKCPNLKVLQINGRDLPEQFLCEIEQKYKVTLRVLPHKDKAMRRFKTFNPRYFEKLTYV